MFDILLLSELLSWTQNVFPDKQQCNNTYSKLAMKANNTKQSLSVTVGSMVAGHGIATPLSYNVKINSTYYLLSLVHTGLDVSALDALLSHPY